MSVSNDPGHFFQTSASLERQERRRLKSKNKNGNPIVLPSKILTFVVDPMSRSGLPLIYTGESGGLARRVNLEARTYNVRADSRRKTQDTFFEDIQDR